MWYVVQVTSGQEQKVCDLVNSIVNGRETAGGEPQPKAEASRPHAREGKLLEECFVPSFEAERKYRGAHEVRRYNLFPGYVIAITSKVEQLNRVLRGVSAFTKILGNGDAFIPLDRAEMAFINSLTTQRHRVIRVSKAVGEGDAVRVVDGPLMGHEAWIRKVNRRKGTANVEMTMFGRTICAEIGLAVVAKE